MGRRIAGLIAVAVLTAPAQAKVKVEIGGVDALLEDNIRLHLGISRYAETEDLTETNVRALHRRATREISDATAPYGYYAPEVSASLERDGDDWIARYDVLAGTPVRVAEVDIALTGAGENEKRLRGLIDAPGIRTGDVLRHDRYEGLKARLLEVALSRGFRDAAFTRSELAVDREQHSARVQLVFDTGERYRFGQIEFEDAAVRESLLRRYPDFAPGDPYDAQKLIDLQYALFDSQYFATVRVEPLPAVDNRVPVRVRTTPGKKRKLSAGIGYGTDTRTRFSASWLNRRRNDRGHRIGADLALSSPRQAFSAQYAKPLDKPGTDRMTYAIGAVQETLGDTDSERYTASATMTRQLGAWQRRLYTRFSRQFDVTGDEETRATLLVPGTTWTRTRSNAVTFPTRGSFLEADLHGAVEGVAADTTFARFTIDARLVRPSIGRDRIIMRLSAGTSAVGDFNELPASERFFAGGDQSVRGFALNTLGPVDEEGQVTGGRHMLTGTIEYERRLFGNWALAFFADGGNAFDDFDTDFEYSAGIGLRWLSPVGMVRLDLAEPLSRDDDDFRVHFSFGPEL